jgi:rhamnulokinase
VPETDGQLVRCCLESLAFKYRQVLQGIESLTGEPIEVIHVVGGGGKNEILNQFTASASGKPVIAGPTEATALGNVLIQARAAGDIGSLAEIREVVRHSSKDELKTFPPQDTQSWDVQYPRFLGLLRKGVI